MSAVLSASASQVLEIVDVIVIVDVIAPVAVAVHLNGNATVVVIRPR